MKNTILARLIACYIGYAVGDAFGATTEFMTPNEIKNVYGTLKDIKGGGWLNIKAGEVTDDTGMCITIGNALIKNRGYDSFCIADSFVQWMKNKPVDIGNTIRSGIIRYYKKGVLYASYDKFSAGNGGLMRVIPIVIYGRKDIEKILIMAKDQGKITHNNELSDIAIDIYCRVLHTVLISGDKILALKEVSELIRKYPVFSFSKYRGENSGYVVDTIKAVFHYYFDGIDFEGTLINVVNNGGDSDTIAALTGALAGATYGLHSIPKRWLKKMNKDVLDVINKQTINLHTLPVRIE
jgi:ADP-ribosyl-[dinitrogen reductase] hydrolase